MNNLPQKIKLAIHGETKTSNESLWRTDKLKDNEVFYQTEWGWGVFVNIEERVLSYEERIKLYEEKTNLSTTYILSVKETLDKHNIPTKLIKLTYNNETIESYE